MKKTSLLAAAAAVAALAVGIAWMNWSGQKAEAQQPGGARMAGPPTTALVDVNYVFKNHARFKEAMQRFDQEVKAAQAEWKRQNEALGKKAERVQGLNLTPGSPEFKREEEALLRERNDLQTQIAMAKRDFVQREAKLYHAVYQEVLYEVQTYSAANGVSLVLNFQGDKMNPDNPQSVISGVNQPVVFYNKDLDITPLVLRRLNGANPQPVRTTDRPVPPTSFAPR